MLQTTADSIEKAKTFLPESFSLETLQNYDFASMFSGWLKDIVNFGVLVLLAILVFIVGKWISKFILKLVDKSMEIKKWDSGLSQFIHSLVSISLSIFIVIIAASILGVSAVSFAALLGAAGLAIGAALSGQLQNLAGGVIILITKPFTLNDYIEAVGLQGTVTSISIFYTSLTTPDNKIHKIPNGLLSTSSMTNYTEAKIRRCDVVITAEYDTPFEKVEALARRVASEDKRILSTPAVDVFLVELGDNSVNIALRAWCKTEDYWAVYFDLNKTIYAECNKEGIGFAFPQLTIHQAK